MHVVKTWHMLGDAAYVVVPLTLSFVVQGEAQHVNGQWAITLSPRARTVEDRGGGLGGRVSFALTAARAQ